jgi:S-adenosylmethionine:tRNA ribosyltransferase-isomerase
MPTAYYGPMHADDLNYDLPAKLIATTPAEPRDSARLMVVDRTTGELSHRHVSDLPELGVFHPGDLMLVNRSRVLPAYYRGTRAGTGGQVRGLYLGMDNDGRWLTMIESRGKLKPGERIDLDEQSHLILITSEGGGEWAAQYAGPDDTLTLLSRIGAAPLPPYIRKARKAHDLPEFNDADRARYNTVYAKDDGSVAAPTAGLHFTPELLASLDAVGVARAEVTLHVGLGTFAPIRCDQVNDHPIHSEAISVPPETIQLIRKTRDAGRSITAVGTTTVRAIESLPGDLESVAGQGFDTSTGLFITPDNGFAFRFTDHLLTNFHLPRSTLLAMVAALPGVGIDRLRDWYQEAIGHGYRFYSYGDAMLIV